MLFSGLAPLIDEMKDEDSRLVTLIHLGRQRGGIADLAKLLRFLREHRTKDNFSGAVGFALARLQAQAIQDVQAEDEPSTLAHYSQYHLK